MLVKLGIYGAVDNILNTKTINDVHLMSFLCPSEFVKKMILDWKSKIKPEAGTPLFDICDPYQHSGIAG